MIDQSTLNSIKERAVKLLEVHKIIRQNDFVLLLEGYYQHLESSYIDRAISELVMDRLISRFEFKIPGHSAYWTIYLPGGSSIV